MIYAHNTSSLRFQHLHDIRLVLSPAAKRLALVEGDCDKLADSIDRVLPRCTCQQAWLCRWFQWVSAQVDTGSDYIDCI